MGAKDTGWLHGPTRQGLPILVKGYGKPIASNRYHRQEPAGMKISTTYFGSQEIDEQAVLTFPHGLLGLEQCQRFKLFHEEGKPTVFWLQSLDDPGVTLSIASPAMFGLGYEFSLTDEEARAIDLRDPNDVAVAIILRRAEEPGASPLPNHPNITGNVNGPLVINLRSRRGMQKVLARLEQTTLLRAV
jgi:flagellar assembly factor FliW